MIRLDGGGTLLGHRTLGSSILALRLKIALWEQPLWKQSLHLLLFVSIIISLGTPRMIAVPELRRQVPLGCFVLDYWRSHVLYLIMNNLCVEFASLTPGPLALYEFLHFLYTFLIEWHY